MNAELCRHAGDRADSKLMLPTELLEQFRFGFPVHKRHPDPIGMRPANPAAHLFRRADRVRYGFRLSMLS
jgi:hypothetical protein